jgi:hypothetical protein
MSYERIGDGEARDYVAYLLRLWRESSGESTQWRASLQDPHSGERVGFASLEELFDSLLRETGSLLERNERRLCSGGEGTGQRQSSEPAHGCDSDAFTMRGGCR